MSNRAVQDLLEKLKAPRVVWLSLDSEVSQLAEIQSRHRQKLKIAVRAYRHHKNRHAAECNELEKLYLGYEGMFMRDHLRDAVKLYLFVNRDYHAAKRFKTQTLRKSAA